MHDNVCARTYTLTFHPFAVTRYKLLLLPANSDLHQQQWNVYKMKQTMQDAKQPETPHLNIKNQKDIRIPHLSSQAQLLIDTYTVHTSPLC